MVSIPRYLNTPDRFLSTFLHEQEFVLNLSILSRGTLDEKLEWVSGLQSIERTCEWRQVEMMPTC